MQQKEARCGGGWFNDSEAVVRAFLSGTLPYCSDPPDCLKGPNAVLACPECLLCLPVVTQTNWLPPTWRFSPGITKLLHHYAICVFTIHTIPVNMHLAFLTCSLGHYRICPLSNRVFHFWQETRNPQSLQEASVMRNIYK